jgi:ribosomal protein L37AE/L43A
MSKYTYDKDAQTISLIPDDPTYVKDAKTFVCPNDGTEMNYHAPTDQWQCPQCGGTEKQDGGKPQTEVSVDEQSDRPDRGSA